MNSTPAPTLRRAVLLRVRVLSALVLCALGGMLATAKAYGDAAPQPAAADQVVIAHVPAVTAQERERIDALGADVKEIIGECYLDTENERDPHEAPDWCSARAKKVLKAVGKDAALAARVLAAGVYDSDNRQLDSLDPKLMNPASDADERDRLTGQLLALADQKVMAYEVVARLQALLNSPDHGASAEYDLEFFRGELSIWTGWRVCQTSDRYPDSTADCTAAWRNWFAAHGKETAAQWHEAAAVARLEDLRSTDLARRDWAVQPWHRLGEQQLLGPSNFAEVAWLLHDALVPGKLTVEQSDHFETVAQAYKCSTRCVLFPPPLAGRTLPPAPPTLAEGKPLLRTLPPRPRDEAKRWEQPVAPVAMRGKVKKFGKLLNQLVKNCWNPVSYSWRDEPALCEPGRNKLDAGVDKTMAAHVLITGYFGAGSDWKVLPAWHSNEEDDPYAMEIAVPLKLLRMADVALVVDYLLWAYPHPTAPTPATGPQGVSQSQAKLQQTILKQIAELTGVALCSGKAPWSNPAADACYAQWSAWWPSHRGDSPEQWRGLGAAMIREDLQSDDLARRYNALANLPFQTELNDSQDSLLVGARWSLRDVLLDPAVPAEVAAAYDQIAAELRCGFRCVSYPPPAAGRNAPPLPALVGLASAAHRPKPHPTQPAKIPAVPQTPRELAQTCRAQLKRFAAEPALTACSAAAAKQPDDAELQIALAWATLDARDAGAAVLAAGKAAAMARGSAVAEAQLVQAAAWTVAGKREAAAEALAQVSHFGPAKAQAQARLAMLQGKAPAGRAWRSLVGAVRCAEQRNHQDVEAFLLRRGWISGRAAWQTALAAAPVASPSGATCP